MIHLEIREDPLRDLDAIRESKKAEYRSAQPFPHVCIDGLFSDELLEKVVAEFPDRDSDLWRVSERPGKSKGKLISRGGVEFGPYTTYLFGLLNSPRFLRFVEDVTGIPALIVDPYGNNGGLHSIANGGFLELHADFSWNSILKIYRRLNLLLYLNKDWKDEYGGNLELWDRKLRKSASYSPRFNRMVIQSVTVGTMHGFPKPIQCPEHMSRKSLAVWYYTARLPVGLQLGYDLGNPGFVNRNGAPEPLMRPVWRRFAPPFLTALLKKKYYMHTNLFAREEFWRTVTRFTPPGILETYHRLRGRDVT